MARTLAMFTDTSLCIGCRACQVACKQWNELAMEEPGVDGRLPEPRPLHRQDLPPRALHREADRPNGELAVAPHVGRLQALRAGGLPRRLPDRRHLPDRVRHRQHQPGRLQRLPVLRQLVPVRGGGLQPRHRPRQQVHLLQRPHPQRARARLRQGLPHRVHPVRLPRRAGAAKAEKRVAKLKEMGYTGAQLYGADSNGFLGGLNAFFLLLDKPSTYNLPEKPLLPAAQRPRGLAAVGGLGAARRGGRARGVPRARRKGGRRCLRPRLAAADRLVLLPRRHRRRRLLHRRHRRQLRRARATAAWSRIGYILSLLLIGAVRASC